MIRIESFNAGVKLNQLEYQSFNPSLIDATYCWEDRELTRINEQATLVIGQLDAYADLVPNIDHFISMYVAKEATLSSKIEGTQTNIEEVLLAEKDVSPEQKDDWREVNNYVRAMNGALVDLRELPISFRLLRKAHHTLMQNVRGENRMPGEFRKSQNWIGGSNLRTASYIPPVWHDVNPLMGDLEKFLHNEDTGLTKLMKIALAHYQFESIHPFLDGNGRVGRLLITLYLVEKEVLNKPVLYLSDYFEKNRTVYYQSLTRVRTENDLIGWMKFFISGVESTGKDAISSLKEVLELKRNCEEKRIYGLGKKVAVSKILLDHLFQQPILDAEQIARITQLSLVSTYKLIEDFMRLRILYELTGNKRNRIFAFQDYFSIFK